MDQTPSELPPVRGEGEEPEKRSPVGGTPTEADHLTAWHLTENIPVGTYVMQVGPDGSPRFTFLSRRWLEMLHLEREAVLADPDLGFRKVHPEEYDDFVRLNQEVFQKKLPFYWEGRMLVDGEVRWFRAESIPRDRPDGTTVWEGVMTDLTPQKTAEARLQASEQRLRRILDQVPAALAVNSLGPDPEVRFVNKHFESTFGYTVEDMPRVRDWADLAYPDEKVRAAVFEVWSADLERALREQGAIESKEFRVTCKDGTVRDVLISARVLDDMLLVSLVDITARKQAEAEREKLIADLQAALEEIRTLSGLLPICAECKNIRDDQGYWHRVEKYVSDRTEARFTHGICPACARKLFPGVGQGSPP